MRNEETKPLETNDYAALKNIFPLGQGVSGLINKEIRRTMIGCFIFERKLNNAQ